MCSSVIVGRTVHFTEVINSCKESPDIAEERMRRCDTQTPKPTFSPCETIQRRPERSVATTANFSEAVEVCEFGSEEITFDQRSDEAMVGGCWELNPTGGTENEGLNEGLRRVSCRNLQVLRCHPCACKLFCVSFPLNS